MTASYTVIQSNPFRRAIGEALALPDRHLTLDALDKFRAGGEGLGAVRRSHHHDQSQIADGQGLDPVDRGYWYLELGGNRPAAVREEAVGLGMGAILQGVHGASWSWLRTTPVNVTTAPCSGPENVASAVAVAVRSSGSDEILTRESCTVVPLSRWRRAGWQALSVRSEPQSA